jgi:hypothetical protein
MNILVIASAIAILATGCMENIPRDTESASDDLDQSVPEIPSNKCPVCRDDSCIYTKVILPANEPGYVVRCNRSVDCFNRSAQICTNGYSIIDRERDLVGVKTKGGAVTNGTSSGASVSYGTSSAASNESSRGSVNRTPLGAEYSGTSSGTSFEASSGTTHFSESYSDETDSYSGSTMAYNGSVTIQCKQPAGIGIPQKGFPISSVSEICTIQGGVCSANRKQVEYYIKDYYTCSVDDATIFTAISVSPIAQGLGGKITSVELPP